MRRRVIRVAGLVVLAAAVAWAASGALTQKAFAARLNESKRLINTGNYEEALKLLGALARFLAASGLLVNGGPTWKGGPIRADNYPTAGVGLLLSRDAQRACGVFRGHPGVTETQTLDLSHRALAVAALVGRE